MDIEKGCTGTGSREPYVHAEWELSNQQAGAGVLGLCVLLIIAVAGYFVAQEFAYMAVDRSRLNARRIRRFVSPSGRCWLIGGSEVFRRVW